jgi:hypothetical protein
MHKFYQTYKSDTSFFTLSDFVNYVGDAVSAYYDALFQLQHGELKKEKKEEIVTFDDGVLAEQIIKIPDNFKNQTAFILETNLIQSFMYDQNNVGLQYVLYKGKNDDDFDRKAIRTTTLQKFSLKYSPIIDEIFFYREGMNKVGIINKRFLPIDEIQIKYVPSVFPEMVLPDGIIDKVMTSAIMTLKESHKDVVVKRSLGNNQNLVMEGEVDINNLKK